MITILGAGIAGLSAAIVLAKNGENVKVIERAGVGKKFGKSVQVIRNYEFKKDFLKKMSEYGLKINAKPIMRSYKYSPSLKKNEIYSENTPIFYALMRGDENSLEIELLKEAEKNGVVVETNVVGRFSDADILACGAVFRNSLGYEMHYVDVDNPIDGVHFFLNNDYAPQGYICVMPNGKNGCEATVLLTSFDENFAQKIKQALEKFIVENEVVRGLLDGATLESKHFGFIHYNVPKTAVINKKLLVGGFAGFTEAARGFGLSYAIISGALAAKSIIEKTNYDVLWKNEFEAELIHAFKRRLFLQKLSNNDYEKLFSIEKPSVSIEEYKTTKQEQTHNFIQRFLVDAQANMALENWRKRYDLSKLIK